MSAVARWTIAAASVLLFATPGQAGHGDDPDWPGMAPETVLDGLRLPADIDVAPDGSVWFIQVGSGNVTRYDPASGEQEVMYSTNIMTGGERGMVGLALAHDFDTTGAFYIYHTAPEGDNGTNRLVRVQDGDGQLLATVPAAQEHNGGRIAVAADGTLFVGTGDNQLRDPAQDPASHLGKILHLTPEGEPVEGNVEGLVYSVGHRNVYGLAIDPDSGDLWATENSGWRRDEVNRIEAGGNYGYPECEGRGLNGVDDPCPQDKGYTFPVKTFYEDRAVAPTGATFWRGGLYWASLNEGTIHHLWQDDGTWHDEVVYDHPGSLLDLAVGPDGGLFFASQAGIHAFEAPERDGDGGAPPVQGVPWPAWALLVVLAVAAGKRR